MLAKTAINITRSRAIGHFKSRTKSKLMYLPSRGAIIKDSRKDQGREGEKVRGDQKERQGPLQKVRER
jgi:hypothetical protein